MIWDEFDMTLGDFCGQYGHERSGMSFTSVKFEVS